MLYWMGSWCHNKKVFMDKNTGQVYAVDTTRICNKKLLKMSGNMKVPCCIANVLEQTTVYFSAGSNANVHWENNIIFEN